MKATRPGVLLGAALCAVVVASIVLVSRSRTEPAPPQVSSATVQAPIASAAPPPEEIDLLRRADVRVTVSSEVNNGTDLPAHLVDGRMDTAWQGATGDLVGAWIGIDVPAPARVHRLGLVPGYAAQSKKWGDLFAANQRIARVEVRRNGERLGEWRLDANDAHMQYFDVPEDDAGTEDAYFRLEVLEVAAGTQRTWREVCVSELAVLGTTTGALHPAAPPQVNVNAAPPSTGPFATLEQACPPSPTACARDSTGFTLDTPPFEELVVVDEGTCAAKGLYLRRTEGWYRLGIFMGDTVCGDPFSWRTAEVDNPRVENGTLVLRLRSIDVVAENDPTTPGIPGPTHAAAARERTYACRVSKGVACRSFDTATSTIDRDAAGGVQWVTTGRVVVNAAGEASLAPP